MEKIECKKILASKPYFLNEKIINQLGQLVMFYDAPDDSGEVLAFVEGQFYYTEFFGTEDFYEGSDYNPVVDTEGNCMCFFEYREAETEGT